MQNLNSYKNKHKGQTCAVLGGGVMLPSDLRAIPQVDVLIGVNQHTLILPLDYVAFLDRHMWDFVEGYRDILKLTTLNKWAGRNDVIHCGECPPIGFSGGLAVWVADQMGFETIYVCGMDQYTDMGGREYWWQGPQSWPFEAKHRTARNDLDRWKQFVSSMQNPSRIYFVSGRLKEIHQ
jgi:hypothetical protein